MAKDHEVTRVLQSISEGDDSAVEKLMPLVYSEFKQLARGYMSRERSDHTLQATSLVNEAYLKLVDQKNVNWQNRSHFFAVGAQAMRRILVDHARTKSRNKRGGGVANLELEEELVKAPERPEEVLFLDEALEKLAAFDERQAKIVEMRFFGGMNVQEVADSLGVSKRTVEGDWSMAKAWLRRELSEA